MRTSLWFLAVGLAAASPGVLRAQHLLGAGVLQRSRLDLAGSTAAIPWPDTTLSIVDERPTVAGSIFVGSLTWYPGALLGWLVTADNGCFDGPCSSSSKNAMRIGAYGGGGLLTGLTVGAIARTSPSCSRSRALRAAILGAEIGSFGTAAVTGLLGDRPLHEVTPYAALALPVVSAATATLLTRRCLRQYR